MASLRVVGLFCSAFGTLSLEVQRGSKDLIQPSLAPRSDKKFFGKDYPDDLRPTIDKAPRWSYPYPKVQSDSKYDVDYVKDENNDGGHWKAQMDYDEIKMKYMKQQAVVREAALKEGLAKDEAMKAAKVKDEIWLKKNNAEAEASKAAEEAAIAASDLDIATKDEEAKEWEAAKKAGKSKKVFDAEQRLEKAEAYLKGCQEALENAKADLARVQAEEAEKAAAKQKAKDDAVTAAKANQAGNATAVNSKKASLSDKQAKAAAANQEAVAAKGAADKEEAEDQVALRSLAEEQAKLDRLGNELKEAEARLRKFRGEPARTQLSAEMKSGVRRVSAWFLGVVSAVLVCAW